MPCALDSGAVISYLLIITLIIISLTNLILTDLLSVASLGVVSLSVVSHRVTPWTSSHTRPYGIPSNGIDSRIQCFADKRRGTAQFALLVIKEHRKFYRDSNNATVLQDLASALYQTVGTGLK